MSNNTKQYTLHEDWTVVLLGFVIIGISLFIFLPEVPVFKWSNGTDLLKDVFAVGNLQILVIQFIYLIVIGSTAVFLTGKSVKNFLLGFPIVYLLTVIALVIAGNTTIKGLNLEAVIFSLIIGLAIGDFFGHSESRFFRINSGFDYRFISLVFCILALQKTKSR